MEALLIEYAKKLGMEKAMKLLGLNQQQNNPLPLPGIRFLQSQALLIHHPGPKGQRGLKQKKLISG